MTVPAAFKGNEPSTSVGCGFAAFSNVAQTVTGAESCAGMRNVVSPAIADDIAKTEMAAINVLFTEVSLR